MWYNLANFNTSIAKTDIQLYDYPFSKKTQIPNIEEFRKHVNDIIVTEEEK